MAVLAAMATAAPAAVYTAVQSGAFNTPATWGEAILFPGNGDTANIGAPHTVTAGANAIASGTTINISGAGKLQATATDAFGGAGTTASVNLSGGGTLEFTATKDTPGKEPLSWCASRIEA